MKKSTNRLKNNQRGFLPIIALAVLGVLAFGLIAATTQFKQNEKVSAAIIDVTAEMFLTDKNAIANQDGTSVSVGKNEAWIGTGQDVRNSFLAMHFVGDTIPNGVTIKSATIDFIAKGGWISTGYTFYADRNNTPSFVNTKINTLPLTSASKSFTENVKWEADKTYSYDITEPIKEILGQGGNSVTIIAKGSGSQWGRKGIYGSPSTGKQPKLHVVYTTQAVATPPVSVRPSATASSSPQPSTSTGSPAPSMPGMTMTPTDGQISRTDSVALTAWSWTGKNKPNSKFDKCDDGTDIVAVHMTYSVIGPDGKRYPTWHPAVVNNPITGKGKCYFGHEHGRDPSGFQFFNEIKQHFAYDADHDGSISANELSRAGIPFGYVNEQILSDPLLGFMRHEDHVGHKIEYANGEGDIGEGTDPFDSNRTGGVVVPSKSTTAGKKWDPSGIRCYHFDKIHQGVHSPDAFSNNLHELIIYTNCVSTRPSFPSSKTIISGMVAFGAPGEFTRFCPDNRTQIVQTTFSGDMSRIPGSRDDGIRNIVTRDCVESTMLVPEGQFSGFPYELWEGSLRLTAPGGRQIAHVSGSWEILDAIRYYDPASSTKSSYMSDVCYETLGNRRARGGDCDIMTNYGTVKGITWDDTRSLFKGIHRGQYVSPHDISNSGGSTYWYTDALGAHASQTPFAGSIKQYVSAVNTKIDFSIDPRIIQRTFSDAGDTVHAPN